MATWGIKLNNSTLYPTATTTKTSTKRSTVQPVPLSSPSTSPSSTSYKGSTQQSSGPSSALKNLSISLAQGSGGGSFSTQPTPQITSSPTITRSTPTISRSSGSSYVSSSPARVSRSAPASPEIRESSREISAAERAAEEAARAYERALKISPDELSTQKDIDELIESTKKGYANIKNKVIPMEFITGQLASTEERALNLAQPLEAKLARLEAERLSAISTSEFALERADARLKEAQKRRSELTAPIQIGDALVRFNEDTQRYETVYELPSREDDGFTLSQGQTRFDAFGNPIASVEKTYAPTSSSSISSSVSPGSVVGADGKPLKLTASQSESISGFNTTVEAASKVIDLINNGVKTGPIEGRLLGVKKLTGNVDQNQLIVEQTLGKIKADFMKAISGAAVSDAEVARLSKFLPDITDQEAVIKSKLNTLIAETNSQKRNLLNTIGGQEAGQEQGNEVYRGVTSSGLGYTIIQ